jgi:hypothetical protein
MNMSLSKQQLRTSGLYVASGGGDVSVSDEDGVVRWTMGLAAGYHTGTSLLAHVQDGESLSWDSAITAVDNGNGRVRRVPYGPASLDSGANPDFRPSRLTDAELHMRRLLDRVNKKSKALDAQMAAADGLMKRSAALVAAPALKKAAKPADPDPLGDVVDDDGPDPDAPAE